MKRSAGRSLFTGGVLSLSRLATGVVRVKVLALALGVEGLGVYAILAQLYLTAIAAVSMSLAVPIINLGRPKLVAGEIDEAGAIAGTALTMVALNAFILVLLTAAVGGELLNELGAGNVSSGLVWPIAIAVVIGALSGAFWEGLSYLCDRFDAYVKVGVIGAVADMVLVAAGALMFGLAGAVYAMPLSAAVMFGAYVLIIGRDTTARQLIGKLAARARLLPGLLSYSALMFTTIALTGLGLTFLRSRVLVEAGATANGYLQTATSMAAYLLAFVMTGFWGHLHPLAAAHGNTAEVRKELSRSLWLGLLIGFTGCGMAAVTAPLIIALFYSREFVDGASLMVAYMPGELCFQLFSMLIAYQLTVSLRRNYLGLNLGYVALLVLAGVVLIPTMGGGGYVTAHIVASFAMATIALLIAADRGQIETALVAKASALIIALTAVSAALLYLHNAGYSAEARLPLLVPFAISGGWVLLRLWRERSQRPATE
jgi:O-antigen/teichoic acid export membrane protein